MLTTDKDKKKKPGLAVSIMAFGGRRPGSIADRARSSTSPPPLPGAGMANKPGPAEPFTPPPAKKPLEEEPGQETTAKDLPGEQVQDALDQLDDIESRLDNIASTRNIPELRELMDDIGGLRKLLSGEQQEEETPLSAEPSRTPPEETEDYLNKM